MGQKILAHNGREAQNALDKKSYDVALVDREMLILNGFETLSEIRKKSVYQPL